jgi:hypothetical protein
MSVPSFSPPAEIVETISKGWYLQRLINHDPALFQYIAPAGDMRTKLYSRMCQASTHRQPDVMSPDKYRQVKDLYGDKVLWVEGPMSPLVEQACNTASKSVGQRKGTRKDIAQLEILALRNGFLLKGGKSITEHDLSLKAEKEIINRFISEQASKQIWTVVRTGSDNAHINYYMGAEYWCVRDDLPLLESDFKSDLDHEGKSKPVNSCSFCHGTVIINRHKPAIGETILQRPTTACSGKVAKYVGFLSGVYHPDKFALPGCFLEPSHMIPPEGSIVL